MWFAWSLFLLTLLCGSQAELDSDPYFGLNRYLFQSNLNNGSSDSQTLANVAINVLRQFLEDPVDAEAPNHRRTGRGIIESSWTLFQFKGKFKNRVSEPCYNAFASSVSSLIDIIKGKFPITFIYMIDSSGKTVSGSMRGSTTRKGSFHQCLQVKDTTNGFEGNYCRVTAEYGVENSSHTLDYAEYQIYPTANRSSFGIELCIPSVCHDKDVKEMVMQAAETYYPDTINFEVTEVLCHQNRHQPLSIWSIFVMILCTVLALVIIFGTAYDIWLSFKQHNFPALQKAAQLLRCFSIPRNMGFILNHQDNGEIVIPSVNAIRSLTLFWVILTNVYLVAKDHVWVNYTGFLEDLRLWPSQIIFNGRFAADTSFCIGGFLAAYLTLKRIKTKSQYSIPEYYLRRYLRLLPSYIMVILLTSGIYYYSINGPDWMTSNEYETTCKQNLWTGFLFLNNFVRDTENCPALSWYLATDMQLHLIAPFIIYPLFRNPRVGLSLLVTTLLIFSTIPALITITKNLPFFTGRLFYFEQGHQDYVFQIFMKPWTHAAPFLVGIFYGYLLYRNGMNSVIKLKVRLIYWLASIITVLVIMFGFHPYIDGTVKMTATTGVLYAYLTPTLWAIAVGWIMYACATGNGGVVQYILSWGVYDVFARLSYCAYLLHFLLISHFMQSRPDNFYYDRSIMLMIFVGALVLTTMGSIILSALVERPFHELLKVIRRKGVKEINHEVKNGSADDDFIINVNNRANTSKMSQNVQNYKNLWSSTGGNKDHNVFTKAKHWLAVHGQSDDKHPLISTLETEKLLE